MRKFYWLYFLLGCFYYSNTLKAQLFIDNGTNGSIYIRSASGGTIAAYDNTNAGIALFVDGTFTNEGTYDNQAAESQFTGHVNNTGTFITIGDEVFVSVPNATITTSINQRITGLFTGSNNFYNFITQKVATQYVDMANSVEVANLLKFNNNGRIRTDIVGHTNDGSAYPFEMYLKNGAIASLVGNSTGNGATEKYIEGKFRRYANTAGIYYYPIGVAPASLDGMEAFELNFSAIPNMDFLGYIQPATVTPITRNVLCDIGKDPGPGTQNFSGCVDTPDGIYDWYYLEVPMDLTHEWLATPSGTTTGYNYSITLHPGNLLDVNNAANYYTIPNACGVPYQTQRIRVVAKDGIVGGNTQVGPGNWAPWAHLSSYIWCQFDNADLDISLNNQTSFSKFRIHGTNLNSNTVLPVELTSLKATPIDNQYIKISWSTASELNNKEFKVLKSTDGVDFTEIGTLNGNGTTNQTHNYHFDDFNVQPDVLYYYKLKQIDFDNTYSFTNIVSAKLNNSDQFSISDIYPNPSTNQAYINIYVPNADALTYAFYNALGQVIKSKDIQLQKGYNKIELNNTDLAKGTYIVRFNYADNTTTKKLIKQ